MQMILGLTPSKIVWSGHSRWLFPCFLYTLCPTSGCSTYAHGHTADLPAYLPQAPSNDCSYQRGSEELALLVSLVLLRPPDINSPVTGNLPPSPDSHSGSKDSHHILPPCSAYQPLHTVGCRSRTLLPMCKLPHPLNYSCLCCWLRALSLVLRLGKHRPCRPVRSGSTRFSYSRCGGQSAASFGDLLQMQIWFRAWILKPSQGMWKIPRVIRLLCGCLRLHKTQSWCCLHEEILWFSELEHNN